MELVNAFQSFRSSEPAISNPMVHREAQVNYLPQHLDNVVSEAFTASVQLSVNGHAADATTVSH